MAENSLQIKNIAKKIHSLTIYCTEGKYGYSCNPTTRFNLMKNNID